MTGKRMESVVSALYDGEIDDVEAAGLGEDRVAAELASYSGLSKILRVPPSIIKEDPFFLTRFRQRRDELRARIQALSPWRRVALRLVPIAASAVLAAVAVLTLSAGEDDALGELEMRAFGRGVNDVTVETTEVEPVLRIALGEL